MCMCSVLFTDRCLICTRKVLKLSIFIRRHRTTLKVSTQRFYEENLKVNTN